MMTKEELLLKGISEETADEIVAGYPDNSDENSENSLQKLNKALADNPEMETLIKADEGDEKKSDDEDEKGDYNESYMKKHMKRYMKENKKSCQKSMKEMDGYDEDMKKAISDIDTELEGAVVEMADLTPFLETIGTVVENMAKAIPELAGRIELVSAQSEKNYSLMQKAAAVTAEQAESMGIFLSKSTGRKGVLADEKLIKAEEKKSSNGERKIIYDVLLKATKEKNQDAGQVLSVFESHGQNIQRMSEPQRKFIADLLQKEAN